MDTAVQATPNVLVHYFIPSVCAMQGYDNANYTKQSNHRTISILFADWFTPLTLR